MMKKNKTQSTKQCSNPNSKFLPLTSNHKGITLVALIITIIVMLILVGVSITIAINGGLFDITKRAAKQTEKAKNAEHALASGRIKIGDKWYDSLEDYAIGKESENQQMGDLNEDNTKFIYNPAGWTNGEVKVKIETTALTGGYTLQYSTDGINWNDYNIGAEIPVSQSGGAIFARLVDSEGNEGEMATGNIYNIDKDAPTISTLLNAPSTTSSSINLKIGITDKSSGFSKIEWYYKLETESTYTKIEPEAEREINGTVAGTRTEVTKEVAITDLAAEKTYNVYAKVYDVAGNSTTSPEIEVTTAAVPTGSSNITFSYSTENWTQDPVNVTITKSSEASEYTLQYSKDGNNWTNYTSPVPMSTNGEIHAKLVDSKGNEGKAATGNVENIDKEGPTINTELNSTDVTEDTISLSIEVTDSVSGISKIEWHYKLKTDADYTIKTDEYTQMNGTAAGATEKVTKETTLENLTKGTYNIYAEVYDVAGNKTRNPEEGTIKVATLRAVEPKIGDYVNYEPDEVTKNYELLAKYSGYYSKQTLSQRKGLTWQVLKIHDDGSIDLIGENMNSVYFGGALGYNNGVYLMHDICKELYSKPSKEIEARSVSLEDFEDENNGGKWKEERDKFTLGGVKYGDATTYTGSSLYYPNLYAQENGSGIDTEVVKTNGIKSTDKGYNSLTEETSSQASSKLTITQTYYEVAVNETNYGKAAQVLACYDSYWVASRSVFINYSTTYFGLRFCRTTLQAGVGPNGAPWYSSNNSGYYTDRALRPVVTLPRTTVLELTEEGTNAYNNPHKIIKY